MHTSPLKIPQLSSVFPHEFRSGEALSSYTWLRVGGGADYFFAPKNEEALRHVLENLPRECAYTVIGAGSNILIRDGGIRGITFYLREGLRKIEIHQDCVIAEAGVLNIDCVRACQSAELGGLEFLATVPGSIGGALVMNAGCYGSEVKDFLVWAELLDPLGKRHRLSVDEIGYGYRSHALDPRWIFLRGAFRGVKSTGQHISEIIRHYFDRRRQTQPMGVRTAGSTFTNPNGPGSAWRLLEEAGYRGKILGKAKFSEKHCNFLINMGGASAHELEMLAEQARADVLKTSGVHLKWEVRRLGDPLV